MDSHHFSPAHCLRTRSSHDQKLQIQFCRTNCFKFSFFNRVPPEKPIPIHAVESHSPYLGNPGLPSSHASALTWAFGYPLGEGTPYRRCTFEYWNHKRFVKLKLSQHIGSSSGSANNSPHPSSLGNCFVNVTTPTQFSTLMSSVAFNCQRILRNV